MKNWNWLCIALLLLTGCAGMEKPPVQTIERNQQITNPSLPRVLQEVDLSTAREITDEEAKKVPWRSPEDKEKFLRR